ncbi:hypothetical protein [Streptomyces sp. HNM0574]|uniref:hypothetical protein n=1 Tax=Streptomyces sp. HNM0574 TaxID=2714954 RepID=UPI00146E5DA2|nr:hypothetical protein [Streptomyces sp. HNM0574]NLU70303.1 hypothetical protein [Streptomyces sp. HNM0574]
MLTLHKGTGVRVSSKEDCPLDPGHALLVNGDRLAEVGPYDELYERYGARARVREWAGELTPGRYEPDAGAWLEAAYHPDPREAAELGDEPLTGAALAALEMTDTRWGASARRGLQRLMACGTTAMSGHFSRGTVRIAVERSRIRVLSAPRERALLPSGAADFAVRTEDGGCLATVLGGRIVHRR